ncbi:hypothetical protein [Roseovarius arcticus]|uniref:hypothetical protein n=1 Tax=Roseovarius arcticus TaxID=2547404 RepID=UPI001BB28161|nr:hypothetical protein [Roseovarius arcticus]
MGRNFDNYLRSFDYDERIAIKIGLDELLDLYTKREIQLIDIRFREEHAAWSVPPRPVGLGRNAGRRVVQPIRGARGD